MKRKIALLVAFAMALNVAFIPERTAKASSDWSDFAIEATAENAYISAERSNVDSGETGGSLTSTADSTWFQSGFSLMQPTTAYPHVVYEYAITFGKDDLTEEQLAMLDGSVPYYLRLNFEHDTLSFWSGKIGIANIGPTMDGMTYTVQSTVTMTKNGYSYTQDWSFESTGIYTYQTSDSTVIYNENTPFSIVDEITWKCVVTADYTTISSVPSWGGSKVSLEFSLDKNFDVSEDSGADDSTEESTENGSGSGGTTIIVLPENAVELLPLIEFTYADGGEGNLGNITLRAGEKYLVVYDGVSYELTGVLLEELEAGAVIALVDGTTSFGADSDTSLVYVPSQGVSVVLSGAERDGETHSIAVYHLAQDYGDLLYDGTVIGLGQTDPENNPDLYMGQFYPLLQDVDVTQSGQVFTLVYDGEMYVTEGKTGIEDGALFLGNLSMLDDSFEDTGESFAGVIVLDGTYACMIATYDADMDGKSVQLYFGDQTSTDDGSGSGSGDSGGDMDSIVNPDEGDESVADDFQNDVSDKKDESDKLREEMDKLNKPEVNEEQLNPLDKIESDDLAYVGNVFGTLFLSNTLMTFVSMSIIFCFLGYVLFGKRG